MEMDIVSASFLLVFILPWVFYLLTEQEAYIYLFIAVIVFGVIIEFVKYAFGSKGMYGRPIGAKGCDLLCLSPNDEGKPGFPSGHTAIATFFILCFLSTILVLGGRERGREDGIGIGVGFLIGLGWIYAIARSRILKKCHTKEQVIAGGIAGILGSSVYGLALKFI